MLGSPPRIWVTNTIDEKMRRCMLPKKSERLKIYYENKVELIKIYSFPRSGK